ncbi:MAG: tetratricopeptide repeat protein [Acidobacteriota bacterium]|nr:MAG: tetratricopeptide repeat protein [Acidobacteriota bacterium]
MVPRATSTVVVGMIAAAASAHAELPPAGVVLEQRRARIAEARGRPEEALAILEQAVARYPNEPLLVLALADAQSRARAVSSANSELHARGRKD